MVQLVQNQLVQILIAPCSGRVLGYRWGLLHRYCSLLGLNHHRLFCPPCLPEMLLSIHSTLLLPLHHLAWPPAVANPLGAALAGRCKLPPSTTSYLIPTKVHYGKFGLPLASAAAVHWQRIKFGLCCELWKLCELSLNLSSAMSSLAASSITISSSVGPRLNFLSFFLRPSLPCTLSLSTDKVFLLHVKKWGVVHKTK